MFSLVEFQNGQYCVVPSSNLLQKGGKFSVKFKGGRYAVNVLLESDDKAYLMECKNKYNYFPLLSKLSSTNSLMQLVPLISKLERKKYFNKSSASNSSSTTTPDVSPLKHILQESNIEKLQLNLNSSLSKMGYSSEKLFSSNKKLKEQSSLPPLLSENNSLNDLNSLLATALNACTAKISPDRNSNLSTTTTPELSPLKHLPTESNNQKINLNSLLIKTPSPVKLFSSNSKLESKSGLPPQFLENNALNDSSSPCTIASDVCLFKISLHRNSNSSSTTTPELSSIKHLTESNNRKLQISLNNSISPSKTIAYDISPLHHNSHTVSSSSDSSSTTTPDVSPLKHRPTESNNQRINLNSPVIKTTFSPAKLFPSNSILENQSGLLPQFFEHNSSYNSTSPSTTIASNVFPAEVSLDNNSHNVSSSSNSSSTTTPDILPLKHRPTESNKKQKNNLNSPVIKTTSPPAKLFPSNSILENQSGLPPQFFEHNSSYNSTSPSTTIASNVCPAEVSLNNNCHNVSSSSNSSSTTTPNVLPLKHRPTASNKKQKINLNSALFKMTSPPAKLFSSNSKLDSQSGLPPQFFERNSPYNSPSPPTTIASNVCPAEVSLDNNSHIVSSSSNLSSTTTPDVSPLKHRPTESNNKKPKINLSSPLFKMTSPAKLFSSNSKLDSQSGLPPQFFEHNSPYNSISISTTTASNICPAEVSLHHNSYNVSYSSNSSSSTTPNVSPLKHRPRESNNTKIQMNSNSQGKIPVVSLLRLNHLHNLSSISASTSEAIIRSLEILPYPSSKRKSIAPSVSGTISSLINDSSQQYNSNCSNSIIESTFSKNALSSTKTTNFSESNNTISEYFPDTTTENLNSTKNISIEQESCIEVVKHPLKLIDVTVPHRSRQTKKHFCIFCKTLHTTLSRHFYLKHKSENKVKEALNFPSNSKERSHIIAKLRKEGDFLHNTSEEHNSGILIVSRQQQSQCQNNADDYVCCKSCKAFFSKKSLRSHLRRCANTNVNARDNFICGRKLTQYIHPAANFILRTKIFPILRNDDVTKAIRYDELVIKYGNKLSEKYTLTHQHDMIRSQLRVLGRFLIEIKKRNSGVEQLKDIFKPSLFDICIEALRKVANWDNTLMWFRTPAVAQQLTSLVKKCGSKQRSEFIKTQSKESKNQLDNFLLLWEEEIPVLINKKALDDQCNQKLTKKVLMPSKSDIKKLYIFLKNKMFDSIYVLQKEFDINMWNELVKSSLIFIQIFNRRRAGEIERLTINSYLNKEVITENVEDEMLQNMSKESVSFAKQFVRLTLRGKLGRTVSVLLSPLCTKAIDLILEYRKNAGIPKGNEFIFSKGVASKFAKPYYRACPLLRQFALECGAAIPESLRGTSLRKHIATYTSLLNVEDATVDKLANFMGHHKDIHKSVYRVSVPVAEVTCVSKLLMSAIGGDDEENYDYEDNREFLGSQDESESDVDHNNSSTSSKRKRSISPYGKTKRMKWTQEDREAILSTFGELKDLKKLPSEIQCFNAIKNNVALKKRTPRQIKSWIDNQRRYK